MMGSWILERFDNRSKPVSTTVDLVGVGEQRLRRRLQKGKCFFLRLESGLRDIKSSTSEIPSVGEKQ